VNSDLGANEQYSVAEGVLFATVTPLTKHRLCFHPPKAEDLDSGGPVEGEKGEGGRGCRVGPAAERGNQLTGGPSREKQTYKIRNQNSKLIQT
jgi:hypothetical protein